MADVFDKYKGTRSHEDAVNVLIEQAGYAVQSASQIRASQREDMAHQLFAAETVSAALIQQADKLIKQYGLDIELPRELVENTVM